MTDCSIVIRSNRLAKSVRSCGGDSERVAWNCIRRRPRLSTAKDGKRRGSYPVTTFDFLGYTFRGRTTRGARGELFFSFNPAVSTAALKSMRHRIRKSNLRNRADRDLEEIAREFNPVLQGWLNYYGRFNRLRAFQSVCAVSVPEVLQPHVASLGHAQICPLSREEDQSGTILGTDGRGPPWTVCALALRDGRCVRLMGAV